MAPTRASTEKIISQEGPVNVTFDDSACGRQPRR